MIRRVILLLLVVVVVQSCDDYNKFERPDWLEGKLFTQMDSIPDIDSFKVAVKLAGYDTIINYSGSYTVFAPDNNAFLEYLQDASYGSVRDIPEGELLELVKYHIVQNPWSRAQLQTLDVQGWIDPRDEFYDEPWGYKRQTLLKDDNKEYWIDEKYEIYTIVDSTVSNREFIVHTPSRKYVPLFFDEYFNIAQIYASDYEDYFDRTYEGGNIYYANAKLYGEENDEFAENGFIYKIDKVVKPMDNVEQLLQSTESGNNYGTFLNTIYRFPYFRENLVETNKQEGAAEGKEVPILYDLDYPSLIFDIHEELTGRDQINSDNTIRYHYGLIAPTNDAMKELIDNYVTAESGYPHWSSYTNTPDNIKRIIVNSHMTESALYMSDIERGFINGEDDSILIDPVNIIQKEYASNATFYGVDKAIVPRAFSSVAGPVYLRPGFQNYMDAMEVTNVLPAIKRKNADYSFFVIDDQLMIEDSSLVVEKDPFNPNNVKLYSYTGSGKYARKIRRNDFDVAIQLLNQVGTRTPTGMANKEFIPTLGGNYIVYDVDGHPETGAPIVTGGSDCLWGYEGDSVVYITPVELEEDTDNGITYQVRAWFSFPRSKFYDLLTAYPWFFNLMDEAGLVDNVYYKLNFISESEFYTVFIPSEEALAKYNTDTLTTEELQQFIKYHFVRGDLLFTDGSFVADDYSTLRVDESSTQYATRYSTLDMRPGPDVIHLHDGLGNLICDVVESDSLTNVMTARDLNEDTNLDFENYIINGVIHHIDTVLLKR